MPKKSLARTSASFVPIKQLLKAESTLQDVFQAVYDAYPGKSGAWRRKNAVLEKAVRHIHKTIDDELRRGG